MRQWQPYMEREHTCLGPETEQDAAAGDIEPPALGCKDRLTGRKHFLKHKRSGGMMQHKEAHQCDHTADHGNGQIDAAGIKGAVGLLLNDTYIGSHGHHFKEDESRKEII